MESKIIKGDKMQDRECLLNLLATLEDLYYRHYIQDHMLDCIVKSIKKWSIDNKYKSDSPFDYSIIMTKDKRDKHNNEVEEKIYKLKNEIFKLEKQKYKD